MPGPSAISTSPATWILASPCGPWSSRERRHISRPAAVSFTIVIPGTEYEETISKARGLLKAIEIAESQLTR